MTGCAGAHPVFQYKKRGKGECDEERTGISRRSRKGRLPK